MQGLLILLLFTAIFIIGYMGFIKFLWSMMQDGGAFDIVFKWGKMRDRMYSGTPVQKLIENAIGGCEQCTSFWWALPWMGLFLAFCRSAGIWALPVVASIIWCVVFCCICSMLGLWILTYKNKSNGV